MQPITAGVFMGHSCPPHIFYTENAMLCVCVFDDDDDADDDTTQIEYIFRIHKPNVFFSFSSCYFVSRSFERALRM